MSTLLLVRANKSRGGGHWREDDYDVRADDGRVVGRIMLHPQAPSGGRSWFWTCTARYGPKFPNDRGYAASREEAMVEFQTQWRSLGYSELE